MLQKRVELYGTFVNDISLDQALKCAQNALCQNGQMSIFTPNLEFLSRARENSCIRKMINSADLSLPDGFSLKIIAGLLGKELKNTVAGIDFGEAFLSLCAKEGIGVFLLGGKDEVALCAARRLKEKMSSLQICGVHHGYFELGACDEIIDHINSSGAQALFVCMGFPLQERFVSENREKLKNVRIFVCLGGSVDVWSGKLKRAPLFFRELHLEWFWRSILEPWRARRILRSLPTVFDALKVFFKERCGHIGIRK